MPHIKNQFQIFISLFIFTLSTLGAQENNSAAKITTIVGKVSVKTTDSKGGWKPLGTWLPKVR
jgi:hypothetical protein